MKKINIWIDCDPGIDDAMALAAAAASQDELKIHGISTVAGNQTSDQVTENALKLASFLGLNDVPVVRGARGPLTREMITAADIHGENGLGNCQLPETDKKTASENGVLYMRDAIMNLPEGEKMTILPVGPMTNMALLLKVFPEVVEKIEKVVLMGGSTAEGNVTAAAEFNIWADPEAAKILYKSGLPIVMCGLDVTNKCGLTREHVEELQKSESAVERAYGEMLQFYFDSPGYDGRNMVCIHDAVTVLYLTNPEIFGGFDGFIEVDCTEDLHRGATLCDRRENIRHTENLVHILNEVNLPEFQKILLGKVKSL